MDTVNNRLALRTAFARRLRKCAEEDAGLAAFLDEAEMTEKRSGVLLEWKDSKWRILAPDTPAEQFLAEFLKGLNKYSYFFEQAGTDDDDDDFFLGAWQDNPFGLRDPDGKLSWRMAQL